MSCAPRPLHAHILAAASFFSTCFVFCLRVKSGFPLDGNQTRGRPHAVADSSEEMPLTVLDCVAVSVHIFTFLLGLPANLLVLFVYTRKARKHGATPNVVYALNLCVANLALVAWLPVKVGEMVLKDWRLPPLVCPFYSFFFYSSLYGSCLFITAVTVGRYLSIAFPIIYKRYRRARLSCYIAAALWVLVTVHLSISLVAEGGAYFVGIKDNISVCYDHFNASQLKVLLPLRLEMAIVLFLLPLIMTCFCTLRCVTLVWRSNLPPMGKRRVLAVALSTLAVFVVCYAPYNASHVVGFVWGTNVSWRPYAMLTSSCNVFLEPVVMLMLSPAVSRGILGRICGQQSQFRRSEGCRHRAKPISGFTNIKVPPSLSEKDGVTK
ncbi:free fatty acid receptor 3 [Melanotaenia boesemani]|uniref:free fatty acid receptor 3 n=1 Tax=Melanotaenia boesemani TaxID=1250792 RepID=UPI001C051035|nr:free fatty acid receptor 3 [Melanotaenia boesemani]